MADVDVGLNVNNNNNNNGNTANNNVNNNNVNEDMGGGGGLGGGIPFPREGLITVQDRLLQTIFLRITLAYARACPKSLRRLFETLILLKAILCFFILIYIHFSFGRNPVSCLEEYKDSWPREGILRVEIMRGPPESYSLAQSYDKERKLQLKHRQNDELSALFRYFSGSGFLEHYFYGAQQGQSTEARSKSNDLEILNEENSSNSTNSSNLQNATENSEEVLSQSESETEYPSLEEEIAELEHANNDFVWPEDEYIFEYSSEHGFLRLPPATREKLNITVKLVVLDPQKNTCFGDSFSQLILQNFLGYDDVLISSIKSLAEHEDNKGFLRNVVSSAHYHFVSRWTSSSSYLLAFLVMMAFTMSISTLSRYSQHQIFVFIMELLQRLEFNTAVTFQAAPLLTEILAFVGMEAIMSEFFENSSTAFYIILIVWVADQYDAICCRTAITKKYWLRFFYLYHLSFYAYHYRFNGQYSGLALVTMWLFTQHSMIYFFHHYELPVILQQVQFQNFIPRESGAPIFRAERLQQTFNNNNNNNDILLNNNNLQPQQIPALRRLRGFNFSGFRFRFGVIFQTHRQQATAEFTTQPQQQTEPPVSPSPTNDSPSTNSPENETPSESRDVGIEPVSIDSEVIEEGAVAAGGEVPFSTESTDSKDSKCDILSSTE